MTESITLGVNAAWMETTKNKTSTCWIISRVGLLRLALMVSETHKRSVAMSICTRASSMGIAHCCEKMMWYWLDSVSNSGYRKVQAQQDSQETKAGREGTMCCAPHAD